MRRRRSARCRPAWRPGTAVIAPTNCDSDAGTPSCHLPDRHPVITPQPCSALHRFHRSYRKKWVRGIGCCASNAPHPFLPKSCYAHLTCSRSFSGFFRQLVILELVAEDALVELADTGLGHG